MPELPEVETVRRGLAPAMVGARIVSVEQRRPGLRFPFPKDFAARLTGQTVTALDRRAKYLVAHLSSDEALVMHLGMTGRFLVARDGAVAAPGDFYAAAGGDLAHDHVVFQLSNGASVTYNDARRFGFMDLVPRADLGVCRHFAGMGIEPLGDALSGVTVARLFRGKRTPLKAALLDQRLIAGLGNIYVSEALFRAGLHPEAEAGTIATAGGKPRESAHRLAEEIRAVLTEAVEAGGSTLRDYAQTDGSLGYFQHRFRVYDREGERCATEGCGATVRRLVQAGRSTFYCPRCQRRRSPVARTAPLG
jgi:formamidopyrimidine-DNA glycosylase